MYNTKFIEDEEIFLRPYEESDADLVYFGKNNSLVRDTLFLFLPITLDQVKNELKEQTDSKNNALFTICAKKEEKVIGQTAFFRIDFVSRAAVFYIAIYNPDYWAKGYGKRTVKLMCKYAFDILNLNRIQLHVSSENVKGIQAYKDAGFIIEGTLREAMYHNDKYVDFYVMGILRKEFYSNVKDEK